MTLAGLDGVATRGELLRRADAAIRTSDGSLTSLRRAVPVLLWSIGLMAMVFAQSGADLESGDSSFALLPALVVLWWLVAKVVPGRAFIGHVVAFVVIVVVGAATTPLVEDLDGSAARTFFLVVWAALAVGTAVAAWSYVTAGLRLVAEIDAWRSARRDPGLRDLDDRDVTPEIATVHDLRDRADYDAAVGQVIARDGARQFELATLKPVFALMVTGVLGLAFFLAPIVGLDDSAWAAANSVSGLILLAPWAWASLVDMNRAIRGRQAEANQVAAESRLYAVRRHHTSGAAVQPMRRSSLLGTPAGLFLLIGWIVVLVLRLRTTGGTAIVITVGILLVGTVVFGFRLVQVSRRKRVFPLAGRGDSVLQGPAREILLELTDEGLLIRDAAHRATAHTVPLADIVSIEPLGKLSPLSTGGVGIVTKDAPVILTGRGVEDDPAVVGLRRRLDPQRP